MVSEELWDGSTSKKKSKPDSGPPQGMTCLLLEIDLISGVTSQQVVEYGKLFHPGMLVLLVSSAALHPCSCPGEVLSELFTPSACFW